MNAINYRVSLDMFDVSSQIAIKCKKGDSACKIHITLTKSGKIYNITKGCSATFSAKKADGTVVYKLNNCTIEGNTIVYDFADSIDEKGNCQVSACEGNVDCEVALYKGDKKLTSPHFNLFVDGTVYNGEEIHSTDMVEEFRVDQTYDPTSKNAQSGIAVAEAISNANSMQVIQFNKSESYTTLKTKGVYAQPNSYVNSDKPPVEQQPELVTLDPSDASSYVEGGYFNNTLNEFANYIPLRNGKGNLYTGAPEHPFEAANKKYVDAKGGIPVIANYDIIDSVYVQTMGYDGVDGVKLISTDYIDGRLESSANFITDDFSILKTNIARRNSRGNLYSGKPIDSYEVANKKYVDEAVANAGGGGNVDLSNYYTKTEIDTKIGDIETLLGGI